MLESRQSRLISCARSANTKSREPTGSGAEEEGVGERLAQFAGRVFLPGADLPKKMAVAQVHGSQAIMVKVPFGRAKPMFADAALVLQVRHVRRMRRGGQILDEEHAPAVAAQRTQHGVVVQQGGEAAV